MEHGYALTAGAGMLDMYTAKSVAFHFGRKVYLTL